MSRVIHQYEGHIIEVVSVWGSPHWRLFVDGDERANGKGQGGFGLPGLSGVRMKADLDGEPLDAFVRNMGVGYRLELAIGGTRVLSQHFV